MMEKTGLVFGKFLPFHKGHEALINFAFLHCDTVTVLVCCSDLENVPCQTRVQWIRETFLNVPIIKVLGYCYKEDELPNTSVPSEAVSKVWSEVFLRLVPNCDLVITSEAYGRLVAKYMETDYLDFDIQRTHFPVSATLIRSDLKTYWSFLPDAVKPYYVKKVVVLGTESTGKSTLTSALAAHYGATEVQEAGRDLIADSTEFSLADVYRVAEVHAARIEAATRGNSNLVIIDTDIHITRSYASFSFGVRLPLPQAIYDANRAGLYLFLCNDVPHVQDGGRFDEETRNKLDVSHRKTLNEYGVLFVEIRGGWNTRSNSAITAIDEFLRS